MATFDKDNIELGNTSRVGNNDTSAHVTEAATDLLKEGKKYANELYQDGVEKMNKVEEDIKEYTEELLKQVQKNPLKAVLIAGGAGLLLSLLLRK